MGIFNIATAGKTVPIKWHLSDENGVDVSSSKSFSAVKSYSTGCSGLSDASDAIEAYSGSSGLQYLGSGNWQYNWKTPKIR